MTIDTPTATKLSETPGVITIWRVAVPGRGTYDVSTYPDSDHIMVQIAGGGRRISQLQGRKLNPVIREAIQAASEDI